MCVLQGVLCKRLDKGEKDMKKQQTQTINKSRTILALLIPIIELALGTLVVPLIASTKGEKIIITVAIAVIGFIAALLLFGNVLKKDWPSFRRHIWRNLALAILGVVAAHLLLIFVRYLIGIIGGSGMNAVASNNEMLSIQSASLDLLGSLTALMAPFTEEIVFRHALFYQWKGRGILTGIMLIVSSIAFGLVHWNNFDGQIIRMIPYMCVGLFFALIYYFSKNIWQSIMTHFFFDIISFASALFIFVITLF